MPPILRPRTVALDTSQWNGITQDMMSSDREKRRQAGHFIVGLIAGGWIPVFAFHHLAELMQHADDDLVDKRLMLLRELPHAAWIRNSSGAGIPGDIRTIQGVEVEQAYLHPNAGCLEVRDFARTALVRFGSGQEAIPQSLTDWRVLREALNDMQEHARKVTAISRWRATPDEHTRLRDLVKFNWRQPAEVAAVLARQQELLAQEITERGDERIPDPQALATEFMREVLSSAAAVQPNSGEPPVVRLLLMSGLERSDIDLDETLGAHTRKIVYLKQLQMLSEEFGLPWRTVKSTVTSDRLPSAIIQDAIRQHSQEPSRRKGSDLNDMHLLCLASYADVTYVDKRTMENVRRAGSKVPALIKQIGAVLKARHYTEILDDIARLDNVPTGN